MAEERREVSTKGYRMLMCGSHFLYDLSWILRIALISG